MRAGRGTHAHGAMEIFAESAMLHRNNTGRLLDHTEIGMESLMAGLGINLTNSVANVRRKLLQMMDALAETGMRHAHREISRGHEAASKPVPRASLPRKRKMRGTDSAVH